MRFCLLLLAAPLFAQIPDLTGVWKRAEGGYSETYTIDQQGATVKFTREAQSTGGRLSSGMWGTTDYTADGIERASMSEGGRATWRTVSWQGASLVVLRVVKDSYRVTVTRESWSLSPDGRSLTKIRRTIDMDGVRESADTFEKQ